MRAVGGACIHSYVLLMLFTPKNGQTEQEGATNEHVTRLISSNAQLNKKPGKEETASERRSRLNI